MRRATTLEHELAPPASAVIQSQQEALARPETRAEAAEALRAVIEQIRLVPENGQLAIDMLGTLAGILSATNTNAARLVPGGGSRVLVAGARFELTTFRL